MNLKSQISDFGGKHRLEACVTLAALALVAGVCLGADRPAVVDLGYAYAQAQDVYNITERTWLVAVVTNGVVVDLTGATVGASWVTNGGGTIATGTCAVVSATQGTFRVTWPWSANGAGTYAWTAEVNGLARSGRLRVLGPVYEAGFGTAPFAALADLGATTGTPIYVEDDPHWSSVSNAVTAGAAAGNAAYAWGNHATNGYLTTGGWTTFYETNFYGHVAVASFDVEFPQVYHQLKFTWNGRTTAPGAADYLYMRPTGIVSNFTYLNGGTSSGAVNVSQTNTPNAIIGYIVGSPANTRSAGGSYFLNDYTNSDTPSRMTGAGASAGTYNNGHNYLWCNTRLLALMPGPVTQCTFNADTLLTNFWFKAEGL